MKRFPNVILGLLSFCATTLLSMSGQSSPSGSPQGRWDAAFTFNQTVIPFRLDVSGEGSSLCREVPASMSVARKPLDHRPNPIVAE
jgi:hypothetical protein